MTHTEKQNVISIIIPCYNEERNLEIGVLDEVYQFLSSQAFPWEIVIVNDESTDNSKALIQQFLQGKDNVSLFDIPHGGKPAAVWAGIQHARGEVVLFTDMDQSTSIHELDKLLPWYHQGYDVVIGSRQTVRQGTSILRKLGSIVFLTLRRLVLLPDIADTQCGFKLCRRQVALETFPHLEFLRQADKPTGWKVTAFDVEFLFLVDRAGYRIKEVLVSWKNRDQSNTKSQQGDLARYLSESINMAREVTRVKLNQMRGFYDQA
ncbi:MAG: glycosyltransferase [Anaerolineae bacterium]|jgi:glycosyltransferase involved in cell wall biosynthesis